ncbi:MAG: hypothetical protein JSU06_06445 [Actinobacteria bacterium]|nr:hypothetical protein [Actinomycetota bacterium]
MPTNPTASAPLEAEGVVVAPDGRIVVAGGDGDAVLAGLAANGAVDPSFGTGGAVVEPGLLPSWSRPRAMAVETNGEIVVTGSTDSGTTEFRPFWMRFGADGALLPTAAGAPFAPAAVLGTQLSPAGRRYLYSLVDEDGRPDRQAQTRRVARPWLRQGWTGATAAWVHRVLLCRRRGRRGDAARLGRGRPTDGGLPDDPDGSARPRFRARRASHGAGRRRDLRQGVGGCAPTGRRHRARRSGGQTPALAELGSDGRLQRGFGHRGIFRCGCGGARPNLIDVAVRGDRIHLLDRRETFTHEAVELVAVNGGGRLALSFAGRGYRPAGVGAPIGLFVRGDRLLVVGQKRPYFQGPSQVRGFRLDGRVDSAIGTSAAVVAGVFVQSGSLTAALQPNGRLVIAGEQPGAPEADPKPLELLGMRFDRPGRG